MRRLTLATLTLATLTLVVGAVPVCAQDAVRLRRAGPGRAGELARAAFARPHDLLLADTARVILSRGTVRTQSVLVVGGDAAVGGTVQGDVTVIGGDLYMHPGGAITGRAIALGGCVYTSSLASISGDVICEREVQYEVQRTANGIDVRYVPPGLADGPVLVLPFPGGLRVPTYTRVDGVGISWGPRMSLAGGAIEIDPMVTYRSATGEFDPHLRIDVGRGALWFVNAQGGRTTRTNDDWIYGDLRNSVRSLFAGRDTRNYYRARYVAVRAGRRWERGATSWSAWLGGQFERDQSTSTRTPWSAFDRRDSVNGMSRPNPAVLAGDVSSALAGVGVGWERDSVRLSATLSTEGVVDAPSGAEFAQTTVHAMIGFPTFGTQRYVFEAHAVHTGGDTAIPQRFVYLGGSGTLPTRDLLSMGGDHLLFIESHYDIPIERLRVPFLGPPIVALRHMLGSAGVDSLPDLVQNIGIRLALRPLRLDYVHDPKSGEGEFVFGVGLGR